MREEYLVVQVSVRHNLVLITLNAKGPAGKGINISNMAVVLPIHLEHFIEARSP